MSQLSVILPRINYIVFELLRIDPIMLAKRPTTYTPTSVKTLELAVMPESLSYKLVSRDAISQTDASVFVQRYAFAPERVRYSGSFGEDKRLSNGIMMDGWQRLMDFEGAIVRGSKDHGIESGKPVIYALNYYDFLFSRFGMVNIDGWDLNANARTNSNLINYTLDFTITDPLFNTGLMANVMMLGYYYDRLLNEGLNTSDATSITTIALGEIPAGYLMKLLAGLVDVALGNSGIINKLVEGVF